MAMGNIPAEGHTPSSTDLGEFQGWYPWEGSLEHGNERDGVAKGNANS